MTEFLTATLAVLALFLGFAALIRSVRHDGFAGPGTGHRQRDELGPFTDRRRPA